MHKSKKNSKKIQKLTGIIKITAKPLGFVAVDRMKEDAIVFEENLNCALDKDAVEVEIVGRDRNRKKGRVTRIIKRNKTKFVGTIERLNTRIFFKPDDWKFYREVDIFDLPKNLEPGIKVLTEINWTNPNLNPRGKIIKVIGKKGEHETEMQSILLDKGIVYDFPADVEAEAQEIAQSQRKSFSPESPRISSLRSARLSSENSFTGSERRDFRNITTFTIDPADAKDFDDALSYEDLGDNKIRVGVHIADVSNFVRPGTALDREARERSFSTYLVDRTVPMLPEILSNGLCSLMPNVDRMAFSAVFDIKKDTGEVLEKWFRHNDKRNKNRI